MTPVLLKSSRTFTQASSELILAAGIVRDAAEALAEGPGELVEAARYRRVLDRLTTALARARVGKLRLLLASPALTDRSGQDRTLIEMIEAEKGDDAYRLRLAKLLFRALLWRPETFAAPPG